MRTFELICLGIPEILLPKKGIDLTKWAVIACDQFTSEPDYWRKVATLVGQSPSTLNLIFPEVYLIEKNPEARIARIRQNMKQYIDQDLFVEIEGFIYVERQIGDRTRKGLLVCLDLEHYDFRKGSTSLIRATEGTILERIPPRVKIREGAPIELPHIMVLIDDPENTVVGPLAEKKDQLEKLYDFELMMGSGHLAGYRIQSPTIESSVVNSLKLLAYSANFLKKYELKPGTPVLLFAMGDGNHSLATAKTIWEKAKENAPDKAELMKSPLRYALVELVNLHDDALIFEPIHRVLFEVAGGRDVIQDMYADCRGRCRYAASAGFEEMKAEVDEQSPDSHKIGVLTTTGFGIIEIKNPESNLPVGTLQAFLDKFMQDKGAREIDYVHGTEPVAQLAKKPGNMGFYLPAMKKTELFKTVILDGVLPRKTFSMGEASEKRFYMEARRLF